MKYDDHNTVLSLLDKAQNADRDNRERARESEHFIHTPDGQWEPDIISRYQGKPRYTFDRCSQYIDDVAGEIESADFSLRAIPASSDATEDTAELYDGMIRHIQNDSDATEIYNDCARKTLEAGFSGWRVVQEYEDGDTMEQKLSIVQIQNPIDNLWFDHGSRHKTHKDARHGFVLKALAKDEYEERFPKGAGQGLGQGRWSEVYTYKSEDIVIGEILYLKEERQDLVMMSNGRVYVRDADFASVADELAQAGITEVSSRKRTIKRWHTRLFDSNGFLTDEQRTVFTGRIPLIPCYGDFSVVEDKVVWCGAIERKKDAQRVYNYTMSREVEEAILSPRAKVWATRTHLSNESDRKDAQTLNTNNKAVQLYEPDDKAPPPTIMGGAPVNPGLANISQNMLGALTPLDQRMPGQAMGLRSGAAIEKEQNAEDVKNQKWFATVQRSIRATGDVLIPAIPEVYDSRRKVQILGEDGVADSVTINDEVFDQQTGKMVTLNPIGQGKYSVLCSVGPQFRNRQQETVNAIIEMAGKDPQVLQVSRDVMLKNTNAPGMDIAAKRMRAMMIQQGLVHPDEFTDEERAQMQQAQMMAAQNQQPDPNMMIAQAEMIKAQNEQTELQIKMAEVGDKQTRTQIEAAKTMLELHKVQGSANKDNAAAMASIGSMMERLSKAGIASPEATMSGMRAIEEISQDLQATDIGAGKKTLRFNPETGALEDA